MEIKVMKNILDRDQNKANEVRSLLALKKVLMVNIISSPGAGKTTLLERTCEAIGAKFRIGVIEGDGKPGMYPMLFREAAAVLLNKIDLIPYTNFSFDSFNQDLKNINSQIPLFKVSSKKGDGMEKWYKWIEEKIKVYRG